MALLCYAVTIRLSDHSNAFARTSISFLHLLFLFVFEFFVIFICSLDLRLLSFQYTICKMKISPNECNLKLGVLYVYDEMANRLISLITRHVLSWQNYLFVKQEKKKDVQNATGDAMLKTTSGSMLEFIIMLINTMKFACFILYK